MPGLAEGDRVRLRHTDLEGTVGWVSAAHRVHVNLIVPEEGTLLITSADPKFFVKREADEPGHGYHESGDY